MTSSTDPWAIIAAKIRTLDPSRSFYEVKAQLDDIRGGWRQYDLLATIDFTPRFIEEYAPAHSRSRFEIMVTNTASCFSLERAAMALRDLQTAYTLAMALDAILAGWEYDHENKGAAIRKAPR